MDVRKIPLDKIVYPPRMDREAIDADELRTLADNIDQIGLLNPITVEAQGEYYMLRAGRRRTEAHRLLNRKEIDANVRPADELGHGELITWTENLERAQLSMLEEARSIKHMMEQTGMSIRQLSAQLHRTHDWVASRIALLEIPVEMQRLVHKKELPLQHALELATVEDDDHRAHLLHYAISSGASFTVIRDWIAQYRLHRSTSDGSAAPLPPMPEPGQPYVVMIPCLTCGIAHPALELRIVRICASCVESIVDATKEWRTGTHTPTIGQSAPAASDTSSTDR